LVPTNLPPEHRPLPQALLPWFNSLGVPVSCMRQPSAERTVGLTFL
jgi:hypothetical protein